MEARLNICSSSTLTCWVERPQETRSDREYVSAILFKYALSVQFTHEKVTFSRWQVTGFIVSQLNLVAIYQ